MKKIALVVFSIVVSGSTISAQDYQNENLYSVHGQSHYKGDADCKARVTMESKNNSLQFIIDIKDDSTIITDDWRNSDHVEIWFNMTPDSNDYYVYDKEFYGGGKIIDENTVKFRNYLLNEAKGNDSLIKKINNAELPIVKELNGMMHWAFNLKDSSAFLYDTEYYLVLPINDEVKNKIKVTPSFTSNGYKVIIEFKPEALLFLKNLSNYDVTFMVDVFDVDGKDKNLSVLSTVKNRKWGAPERFNHHKIKQPIVIEGKKVPNSIPKNTFTFYHYKDNSWKLYKRKISKKRESDLYYRYTYTPIEGN